VRSKPPIADRLAGAVWGHLIGDAVGVPYEFGDPMPAKSVRFGASGAHGQPPGTWSDDGALMLALLDSLLEKGFDSTDQAVRSLAWYRDGAYTPDNDGHFDIGGTTGRALRAFESGVPAEHAGPTDERSCGNGSLMRILPLALVERDLSPEELVDHAHRASKVTHGHHRTQVSCALYVLIARRMVKGRSHRRTILNESRVELRELYESGAFEPAYLAALDELEGFSERSGDGYVLDSFWSAWDAFQRADSYEDSIKRAVAYGNDTDTTAAIAGGLAGLRWGIGGIPAKWLSRMRGRGIAEPIAKRLIETTFDDYTIYVIQLDEKVWKKPKMKKRNPNRRFDKPCVYVGYSFHTPEERYRQHMSGQNDSAMVRDYGLCLREDLYRNARVSHSPEKAQAMEAHWAGRLRRRGFGVWEGRLGPLGVVRKKDPDQ